MRVSHSLILLLFFFFFFFSSATSATKEIRAGFWPPFSNSYAPPSSIDTSVYTHIFYAFLGTKSIDTNFTFSREELPLLTTFSTTLKTKNPSIKTLLSIGGLLSNSTEFSAVAADRNQRKAFIDSAIALARAHGFDGLDFAWEFPASPEDMDNLGVLLNEWKREIEEEAQNSPPLWSPLLLTATVYFSNHLLAAPTANLYYPVEAMAQSVDWVNAMCFDYQGSNREEQDHTKAHAALFNPNSQLSTSYGIDSWMDAGLPSNKLVMGIPLYGRSWILKNKEKNGIGAAAVAFGPRQRLSNQTGVMAYSEIQKFLQDKDATLMYDNSTVSAYSYAGDLWVSFDSQGVVAEKISFAKQNRLLGYFLWPITFDSNYSLSMTG
ncbi:Chitinase-3-like protein 1 [Nymphaea thermarum]|nr:Chitinase-3-like protein 1 [Nymphaea thermarum]